MKIIDMSRMDTKQRKDRDSLFDLFVAQLLRGAGHWAPLSKVLLSLVPKHVHVALHDQFCRQHDRVNWFPITEPHKLRIAVGNETANTSTSEGPQSLVDIKQVATDPDLPDRKPPDLPGCN